ncbi:MAG: penicillin-binding transpeptidase domain-containing protein [Planctomycetota bacterium]
MFKRRLMVFLALVGLGLLINLARLAQLQLVRGADYAQRVEQRMIRRRLLDTHRGDIVDRYGRILATDRACFALRVEYRVLLLDRVRRRCGALMGEGLDAPAAMRQVKGELAATGEAKLLARWIRRYGRRRGLSETQARRRLTERVTWTLNRAAELTGRPRAEIDSAADAIIDRTQAIRLAVGSLVAEQTRSHVVLNGLDEQVAVNLRGESAQMVGTSVGPSTERWYPYPSIACHVIGRTGRVSAETLREDPHADDPLLGYLPAEDVGVTGVEKLCESTLRGVRGSQALRRGGEEVTRTPPTGGATVRLTLDIDLQQRITELLAAHPHHGAAVVLHVPTGEVLALVSTPTYDLNHYGRDIELTRALLSDEANLPLLNRAVARDYPPGSTVKPITALAGLSEGVITSETSFFCRGKADPRRPRCWSTVGHGSLSLSEAIMHSCNNYFARTADRLEYDQLIGWMRRFGIGEPTGLGLPGETDGLAPDEAWMRRRRDRPIYPGEVRAVAIGQGLLLATPLQIANATATLARDGQWVAPLLVVDRADRQVRRRLPLEAGHMAVVREGMYRVINDPASQTGYRHAKRTGPVMCGKTGTAQTGRPNRHMAWFTGFVPRENPRIAFAFVIENTPDGGADCIPLAETMIGWCEALGYFDE